MFEADDSRRREAARLQALARGQPLSSEEMEAFRRQHEAWNRAEQVARRLREEERQARRANEPWYVPFSRALRAAAFLTGHVLIAVVLISGVTLVNVLLEQLGNPKLFHRVDLSYVFDGIDLLLLLVFGVFGVSEAITVFKE